MMQIPTSSAPLPVHVHTEKAKRHKDGSVLLSIADDRICKLNGVGALTWMILEENPEGLSVDEVARELSEQFETINSEGELRYEVSPEQLREDTTRFLKNVTEMNLLEAMTDSRGQEFYYIKEGVSGTTSATVAAVAAATAIPTPAETESPQSSSRATLADTSAPPEAGQSTEGTAPVSADEDIKPLTHETFTAFMGLLAFDLLLKFRGFQSLIKRVENWPTAQSRATDREICQRVRAMVDRAQMYYPKKAMCLQHSAVVTCLLRRRGVPAEMVLAAQALPPKGHAWAEVEGEVINDSQRVKGKYLELRRI
jgi:hypothetical protein